MERTPLDPNKNGRTALLDDATGSADSGDPTPARSSFAQIAGEIAGLLVVPLLVAAFIYWLINRKTDVILFTPIALALIFLLAYVLTHPRTMMRAFGRRRVQGSLIALITTVLLAGVLIVINLLVQGVTVRKDFSTDQTSQISDQTIQVLNRLNKKVKVSIVYATASTSQSASAADLLREYQVRNNGITVERVNSDNDPATAQLLGVTDPFVTVFSTDKPSETQRVIGTVDEASYTGALIKIISPNQRTVTFITGHGELSTATTGTNNLSALKQVLLDNNFLVNEINLSSNVTLNPSDILIIAGASTSYSDQDKTRLSNFLKAGGKALIMDTGLGLQQDSTLRSNINDVLSTWNVKFQNGTLWELDPNSILQNRLSTFLPTQASNFPNSGEQAIKGLSAPPVFVQPDGIAQVDPNKTDSNTTYTPLIQSSTNSFLCLDLKTLCVVSSNPVYDQKRDVAGPVTVMAEIDSQPLAQPQVPGVSPTPQAIPTATAALTPGSTPAPTDTPAPTATPAPTVNPVDAATTLKQLNSRTRIILIGTSTSALTLDPSFGNKTLFVNSVNWLAQQTDTLSIPSREPKSRPITLTEAQQGLIFWGSVAFLPLLVLALGIVIWWRRR